MSHYPIEILPPNLNAFSKGNCGTPYVFEFVAAAPGPTVMICALTHGNEYSGAIVVSELLTLGFKPARGKLILSFNNIAAFNTFNPDKPDDSRFIDEDLNRVWSPNKLDSQGSSVELNRARQLRPFVDQADYLLDLHSMHEAAPPMLVCGPLEKGRQFGRLLGTPRYLMTDMGHSLGTRLRDYGQFGQTDSPKQAALLEAGQHWQASALRCAKNVTSAFLLQTKATALSDLPTGWLTEPNTQQTSLQVTEAIEPLTHSFQFSANFKGFEQLAAHDLIGFESINGKRREIRAPYDQCVLVMPSLRHALPGVTIVRLARVLTH